MALGPEMQPYLALLRRAYPAGLPDEEYLPLLAALSEGFSARQLAALVAEFTGRDRFVVDNDHAAVRSVRPQDRADVKRVYQRLADAGYVESDD